MSRSTASISFSPPPDLATLILDECGDASLTFRDIALRHSTSTEALALWLQSPDIRERLENNDNAVALHTRRIAANFLPRVAHVLNNLIDDYQDDQAAIRAHPDLAVRVRARESIRRTFATLVRLSRTTPVTHRAAPTPAGTGSSPPVATLAPAQRTPSVSERAEPTDAPTSPITTASPLGTEHSAPGTDHPFTGNPLPVSTIPDHQLIDSERTPSVSERADHPEAPDSPTTTTPASAPIAQHTPPSSPTPNPNLFPLPPSHSLAPPLPTAHSPLPPLSLPPDLLAHIFAIARDPNLTAALEAELDAREAADSTTAPQARPP